MQNTSKTYDDLKSFTYGNRMYFTSDSTKAAMPGLVDYREDMVIDDAMVIYDTI